MKNTKMRFLRLVDKRVNDRCWVWRGCKRGAGYGGFILKDPVSKKWKSFRAHRVSANIFLDVPIHTPMLVLHRCDNRLCVNPKHLFLGTNSDNSIDAVKKGRMAHGEKNGASKLKESEVSSIKKLLKTTNLSYRAIGRKFGVSHTPIIYIDRGIGWKNTGG